MPSWLTEGNSTVYFLIACAVLACAAMWWRTRKRKYVVAVGVCVTLLAGYFLLDRFVESDREEMIRRVEAVVAAVNARDLDNAFVHVSDQFNKSNVRKSGFRSYAHSRLQSRFVTSVQAWDYQVTEVSREHRRGAVEFFFKVRGSFGETPPGFFAKVVFVLDPDGAWRIQNFDVFLSITESTSPYPIPGWGTGE